jgi:hypothetical protein
MAVFSVTSKSYPEKVETPSDFPVCPCGGKYVLTDVKNKRGKHVLTNAECDTCKEYFCGHSVDDMRIVIPSGLKARNGKKFYLTDNFDD